MRYTHTEPREALLRLSAAVAILALAAFLAKAAPVKHGLLLASAAPKPGSMQEW